VTAVAARARLERVLGTRVRPDQPLGARTTYRVGGPAALLVEAGDEQQLLEVGRAVAGTGVPVLVVGRGSNLLVSDRGFDGLAVVLGPGFESISLEGDRVRAGAAVSLPVLARRTAAAGLQGLEWAVGVPGSVGGAVRMNAGGHGSDTAATLVSYRWVDLASASVHEGPAARLGFGYRHAELAPTDVVVEAVHRLVPGGPDRARAAIDEIVRWRRAHQPGGANAGSVFTNPPGDSAGRLIEACGLKGFRVGTAEVSPKHANFIQADPGGSADDVLRLIDQVRARVAAATGVTLRTEVRLVGFPESESESESESDPEVR
jgi:UDP-N-acetylmuramate dehydrogenase